MPFRAAFSLNDGTTKTGDTAMSAVVPASVQAGDTLAVITVQNTGVSTHSIAGGGAGAWTVASGPDDNNSNQRTYVFTKAAGSDSAGGTITVTASNGGRLVGAGFAASGLVTGSLIIGYFKDTNSDVNLNFPSVNIPAGGNDWEIYGLLTMRASVAPHLTAPPAGAVIDVSSNTNTVSPNYTADALHQTATQAPGSSATLGNDGTTTADQAVTNNLYTLAFQTSAPPETTAVLAASAQAAISFSGLLSRSVGMSAGATAAMSLAAVREQFGSVLLARATPTASIAAVRSQLATLPLVAGSALDIQSMPQGTLLVAGHGSLALAGSKALSAVLPLGGASGLAVAAVRSQLATWAVRATPAATISGMRVQFATLVLAGHAALLPNTGQAATFAPRAVPALLIPTTHQSFLRTLVMRAVPALIVNAILIGDIHTYKRVTAVVLDNGQRLAELVEAGGLAELISAEGIADLLGAGH